MKRVLSTLLFGILAVTMMAACDSNEDEGSSDLDQLVGVWNVTAVSDANGDQTALFQLLGTIQITLNEDQTYRLLIDRADPTADDTDLPGSFTIDEAVKQLILSVTLEAGTIPVAFGYEILNEQQTTMSISALLLSGVLTEVSGLLSGTVVMTLTRA